MHRGPVFVFEMIPAQPTTTNTGSVMFNVLQQPPPSVSICKTSVVISAYCTYLNNSNSEPHPDTNTNRKRCKVNLKGKDFRELMGIADKQKQLDKAIEIASTRLHASLDKQ